MKLGLESTFKKHIGFNLLENSLKNIQTRGKQAEGHEKARLEELRNPKSLA